MRLQHELALLQRAPSAREPFAVLEEINGPLEFVAPAGIDDLSMSVVDQNQ